MAFELDVVEPRRLELRCEDQWQRWMREVPVPESQDALRPSKIGGVQGHGGPVDIPHDRRPPARKARCSSASAAGTSATILKHLHRSDLIDWRVDGATRRRLTAGVRALVRGSGEAIRVRRELSRLSMRQFAGMAGISNPYLSQIERGLREPSERVVDAIARSLETSAEALYEQAGLVTDDDGEVSAVPSAIEADQALTPRQRRALLDVYEAFVAAGPAPRPRKRRPRRADGAAVES